MLIKTHTQQVIITKTTAYWCHSTVLVTCLIYVFLILFLSKPLEQNLLEEFKQGGKKQKETTTALNLTDGLMCTGMRGFNRKLCMHDCQQDYPLLLTSKHQEKAPASESDLVRTSQKKAVNKLTGGDGIYESMVALTPHPALQRNMLDSHCEPSSTERTSV